MRLPFSDKVVFIELGNFLLAIRQGLVLLQGYFEEKYECIAAAGGQNVFEVLRVNLGENIAKSEKYCRSLWTAAEGGKIFDIFWLYFVEFWA